MARNVGRGRKVYVRGGNAGMSQDEFKQMWNREKKRLEIEIENEVKKKYDMQRRSFDRERRKFEQNLTKYRKEKKDLSMLKHQVDTEKRVFITSLRKNRGSNFNPNQVLKELQDSINKSVNAIQRASEEWENLQTYKENTEKSILEQTNNLKKEQANTANILAKMERDKLDLQQLEQKQRAEGEELDKRRTKMLESEKSLESESQRLQGWDIRLRQEQDVVAKQREENTTSAEILQAKESKFEESERELWRKKNECDKFLVSLQEKESNLNERQAEINLNSQKLEKEQKEWDAEQKQIYFDGMFTQKRGEIELERQELLKQKADLEKLKAAQEAMDADLKMKLHNMEKKQKHLDNTRQELEGQLVIMDQKTAEMNKREEELNKRMQDVENALSKQGEREKELKVQQDQIDNEYGKLQSFFETKVRKELANDKNEIELLRIKAEEDRSKVDFLRNELNKEKSNFEKRKLEEEREMIRSMSELQIQKVNSDKSMAILEERQRNIAKMDLIAKQEEDRLARLNNKLQSDRANLQVIAEKDILDKYKTMMSYAENDRKELLKEREKFDAEQRRQEQQKLEFEKRQENLENEIEQRVNAQVIEKQEAIVRYEKKVKQKNEELELKQEQMEKDRQAMESAQLEVNQLKCELERRLKDTTQKQNDLHDEKNRNEELHQKVVEAFRIDKLKKEKNIEFKKRELEKSKLELNSKIKDLEKKEQLYVEKMERLSSEWTVLESEGEKLSELVIQMQAEAMRRVKNASTEKSQIEQFKKEVARSPDYIQSSGSEIKKDSIPDVESSKSLVGVKLLSNQGVSEDTAVFLSPSFGNIHSDFDQDERIYDTLSLPHRGHRPADSVVDNFSVIYDGFYPSQGKNEFSPSIFHILNSKAKAPRRKLYKIPSSTKIGEYPEAGGCRIPTKNLVNMIEAGEHTVTTFFHLGAEKEVIQTIKGVMMDISPKIKNLVESNEVVELPDITVLGFETMLQFVYSNNCSLRTENVVPTMACASKFELNDLYRNCFDWLEVHLRACDAGKILDDCIKHAKALGVAAKQAIEKSAWDIMISDGENINELLGKVFKMQSKEWIRNVLEGNSLVCPEEILFDAVVEWACHQASLKYAYCQDLTAEIWNVPDDEKSPQIKEAKDEVECLISEMLPFVRFPNMPMEYITKHGLIASLLQPAEILEVLRYQHDPRLSNTKFHSVPRYKINEVSLEGCCAQSSEHFAVFYTQASSEHDEKASVVAIVPGNLVNRVLTAEQAISRRLFQDDNIFERLDGLDAAQTKFDYQPWWDMDLGRLCRIQKIQVFLGEPGKIPGQKHKVKEEKLEKQNDMFPMVLCLGRREFPGTEGSLTQSLEMAVKKKVFDQAPPEGSPLKVEWEPGLVAARTVRVQCERQTILRILQIKIFSAEPVMRGPLPQIENSIFV